jgi:hypothetical protein
MELEVWEVCCWRRWSSSFRWAGPVSRASQVPRTHGKDRRERAAEAKQLSWRVMQIFGDQVDLGMMSIQDIPQLPKWAQEVMSVVDLALKCLQKALASGAGPWD